MIWFVERGVATLERPVAPRCLKLRCVSLSTQLLRQSTSPDSPLQGFQLAGKVADPSHHAVTKEAFWWCVKDKTDYNRLICSITIILWQYRDRLICHCFWRDVTLSHCFWRSSTSCAQLKLVQVVWPCRDGKRDVEQFRKHSTGCIY